MKNLKFIIVLMLIFLAVNLNASTYPTAGRIWNYNIITASIFRNIGIITIPGFKYEYLKYMNDKKVKSKGLLVYEFFIGPYYIIHLGKIKVMVPVVYHYMGFPDTPKTSEFSYNYNVDIFPSFSYRISKSLFQWRIFFHNTFYSSFYKYIPPVYEGKSGYSLLLKLRSRYSYWISKKFALSVGDEILYGVIENKEVPSKTGPGFTENGIDGNRVMGGCIIKIFENFTILPYCLYETTYAKNKITSKKELKSESLYLSLFVKYNFKL